MALTFIGATVRDGSTVTPVNVSLPVGSAAGDLLILAANTSLTTVSLSGATTITPTLSSGGAHYVSSASNSSLASYVLTSTDISNGYVTLTAGAASEWSAIIWVWRGALYSGSFYAHETDAYTPPATLPSTSAVLMGYAASGFSINDGFTPPYSADCGGNSGTPNSGNTSFGAFHATEAQIGSTAVPEISLVPGTPGLTQYSGYVVILIPKPSPVVMVI